MKKILLLMLSSIVFISLFGCSKNTESEKVTIENKESSNEVEKVEKAEDESTSEEVIKISFMENSEATEISFKVLVEAYKRIGIKLEREVLPAVRALEKSNLGETDGETMRVKGIEKDYPNLVMVNEPVFDMDFVSVVKDKEFEVNGIESLKPYKLGYIRGILFIENMTKGMDVEEVENGESLLKKIDIGRTDVGIMSRSSAEKSIKDTGLDVKIQEPPVSKLFLYHYLNKDKSHLIEKIEKTLKEMKEDGTWDEIRKK